MKKITDSILVFLILISATQVVQAIKPEQPWLLTPLSEPALATDTPILFSWLNTTAAKVKNYRLVISTNKEFAGYNQATNKCSKTCFTTTVSKTTYSLPKLNTFLKADNNYFWRVEAINSDGSSISDIKVFSFGTDAPAIDPKFAMVTIPKVETVSTDKSSIVQGDKLIFSATLDGDLPTGYSVKVNYGNGLILMTTSTDGFSYTATPPLSASLYSVGIYDSKNVLKSNKITGNIEVTAKIPTNIAPVLTFVSGELVANTDEVYNVQLSATDANGNLRLINIDWGDKTSDVLNATDGEKVTFSHTYTSATSYPWRATAYDYNDAASATPVTKTVVVSKPTTTTSTTTSIPTDVTGCYIDKKTGLTWEVKTNDGNLHDKNWSYSWYEPDATKNGGYAGVEHGGRCGGTSQCNTYDYVNSVNTEGLCGATDWRLPTKSELEGLVLCSDKKSTTLSANQKGYICTGSPTSPTIDTENFPNTKSDWFWSSSIVNVPVVEKKVTGTTTTPTTTAISTTPAATLITTPSTTTKSKLKIDNLSAWNVVFFTGYSSPNHKGNAAGIRLVRSGK